MDEATARTANLLGAAALTSADWMRAAAADAAGTSVSGAAALVTLRVAPGLGVTELGQRVGLSQPAAARMVDSLVTAGLVERRQTSSRAVELSLTRRGRAAAARALDARGHELGRLVQRLGPAERTALATGLEALLAGLYQDTGAEQVLCRLCDRSACLGKGQVCPVGRAARDADPDDSG